MRHLRMTTFGTIVVLCLALPVGADIINGGFEDGLNDWTYTGTVAAIDFEYSRDFLGIPQEPFSGFWEPIGGDYFGSLWSTDLGGTNSSTLSQTFDAVTGDTLSFHYFFDFGDEAAYPDTATATLSWSGGSVNLFEHNTPGTELGDDENVPWTAMMFTLPDIDTYTLEFAVEDWAGDFESILGVDTLEIVPVPAPGAVALGALGLGMVGWVRRRLS